MIVRKMVAHLCLVTLIIKELKFSVEHDHRVVTTLNTIKH